MSLAKLFLSGLLIAGGLILGAFTLHGYFDPQWAQKQAQLTGVRERPQETKKEPRAINAFQNRSRFVSRSEPSSSGDRLPPAAAHAAVSPALVKTTDAKPAAKPPVKKKVAEKPKPPQQASVWPWNLFSSN